MDILLGIDVGTSSVKTVAVDLRGRVVAESQRNYTLKHPQPGWAELHPHEWWDQTIDAVREVVNSVLAREARLQVLGLGLTGQMHSLVLLDANGSPVRPAITWLDSRARSVLSALTEKLAAAGFLERIKNQPAPGLTVSMLVWLARHEPEVLERAKTLLLPKDYIRYRLTGELVSDFTDASSTLLFDTLSRTWFGEAAELLGIPTHLFPPLRDTYAPGSAVRPEVLGLPSAHPEIPVATGCSDQQAAALTTGVILPGAVQLMLGTGAQVLAPVDTTELDTIRTLNFFAHHYGWIVQGSVQNAGSALSWAMKALGADWDEVAAVTSIPTAKDDPYFLPYLSGERTPIMDPNATGAWVRLRPDVERTDLLRTCMEGIVFGITDAVEAVLDVLRWQGPLEIRVSGGGIRLRSYVQMICDALGQPLSILSEANATGIGAAMLGGVAGRQFRDLDDGFAALGARVEDSLAPDAERHQQLGERRAALRPIREAYLHAGR